MLRESERRESENFRIVLFTWLHLPGFCSDEEFSEGISLAILPTAEVFTPGDASSTGAFDGSGMCQEGGEVRQIPAELFEAGASFPASCNSEERQLGAQGFHGGVMEEVPGSCGFITAERAPVWSRSAKGRLYILLPGGTREAGFSGWVASSIAGLLDLSDRRCIGKRALWMAGDKFISCNLSKFGKCLAARRQIFGPAVELRLISRAQDQQWSVG